MNPIGELHDIGMVMVLSYCIDYRPIKPSIDVILKLNDIDYVYDFNEFEFLFEAFFFFF